MSTAGQSLAEEVGVSVAGPKSLDWCCYYHSVSCAVHCTAALEHSTGSDVVLGSALGQLGSHTQGWVNASAASADAAVTVRLGASV